MSYFFSCGKCCLQLFLQRFVLLMSQILSCDYRPISKSNNNNKHCHGHISLSTGQHLNEKSWWNWFAAQLLTFVFLFTIIVTDSWRQLPATPSSTRRSLPQTSAIAASFSCFPAILHFQLNNNNNNNSNINKWSFVCFAILIFHCQIGKCLMGPLLIAPAHTACAPLHLPL